MHEPQRTVLIIHHCMQKGIRTVSIIITERLQVVKSFLKGFEKSDFHLEKRVLATKIVQNGDCNLCFFVLKYILYNYVRTHILLCIERR